MSWTAGGERKRCGAFQRQIVAEHAVCLHCSPACSCKPLLPAVVTVQADAKRAHQEAKRAQQDLAAAEARVQAAEAATQRARGAAEVDAKSHVRVRAAVGAPHKGW